TDDGSAAGPTTATDSSIPASPTPTAPRHQLAPNSAPLNPIQTPRPSSGASSTSTTPASATGPSHNGSNLKATLAPARSDTSDTRDAQGSGAGLRSAPSSSTPAISAARSPDSNAATTNSSTPATPPS